MRLWLGLRLPAVPWVCLLAAVSCGGVIGALARYGLQAAYPHSAREWDWATLSVNVSGCLLIGIAHRKGPDEFETLVNPPPDARVNAGDAVILIGTIANSKRFRRWFGAEQGR